MIKKIFIGICFLLLAVSYVAHAGTVTTSSITAQTIIDRATRNLHAANDSFFTDNDFIQWTDEAVRETVNKTRCLESGSTSIILSENTRSYDLSTLSGGFLDIQVVEHDSGVTTKNDQIITLDLVNKNEIGHSSKKGRPQLYCLWNDQLEIWPIPRSDESGTTLYVYVIPLPSGVTATTSVIETPAYLDTALVYYVTAMGKYKDRRIGEGNAWMVLFETRIKEYMINVQRRNPVE